MDVITRNEAIRLLAERRLKALTPEERESVLLDWWTLDENTKEYAGLPASLRARMKRSTIPSSAMDHDVDPLLAVGLRAKYRGVRNEYLARKLSDLGHLLTEVTGEPETLLKCPCCGYRTLQERGIYEICPVCYWEDDGTQESAEYSGPNHVTLAEARASFAQYGACSPAMIAHVDPEGTQKYRSSSTHEEPSRA